MPKNTHLPIRATFALGALAPLFLLACTGVTMKGQYSKSSVQPVAARPAAEGLLSIQYTMPPESMYFSPGVNYEKSGDTLKVAINRCGIREQCETMAKVPLPLKQGWQVEVKVPYAGEKVVMVYADQEEQIYPEERAP